MALEAVGSSPLEPTFKKEYGGLAQLGEHLPCKQGVASSNLAISIGHGSGRQHLEN